MEFPDTYLSLLVHPQTKTPLAYNPENGGLFVPGTGESFPVRDGVPVLLAGDKTGNSPESPSAAAGPSFDYRAHYQQDAVSYDYESDAADPIEREENNRLRKAILARIAAGAQLVLDAGCGGGWLAKALTPGGTGVISMDISDINPVRAVKTIPSDRHFGLVADAVALPLKDNSVDCIVASEIMEHVTDPGKFVKELFRAVKPGGRLILTTPYNEKIRQSLCIHCNRETPQNAHLHSFTEQSVLRYLPENARRVHTRIFNSKLLIRTRLQYLLRFLPQPVWEAADNLFVSVTGKKAYRLMIILDK